MTFCCNGIGISTSRTIAIGQAHLLQHGEIAVTVVTIEAERIDEEINRFSNAAQLAHQDLVEVLKQLPRDAPADIKDFIQTHLLMMQDQALTESVEEIIRKQHCNAEWALKLQRDALIQIFDEMEDAYLRTRKDDLDHVVNLVLKRLLNISDLNDSQFQDLIGKIVIAHDLSPADTILLRNHGIAAFVTESGSPMSHTAILARSMGIPAIVGAHNALKLFNHGETVVVDSHNGIVTASPDSKQLKQFRTIAKSEKGHDEQLRKLLLKPCISEDGKTFNLLANIEMTEDIDSAKANGADAIGLYRTEFLYMNRSSPPTEEEHLEAYTDIIQRLNGLPLTIRTLDLGADKTISNDPPVSANPALGLRAIRLCLREPDLFITQLRAILRASAIGPVRLMLPMLTHTHEVDQSLRIIRNIQQEMLVEGIPFDRNIQVGGMIEVPAAALSARAFANRLDFLSIGTNDLIQYTLAVDRMDDETSHLYDPLHPSVLKLIQLVINAGQQYNIPVSMCGEMAGDSRFAGLLAGLGLRDFSMQPNSLLMVRERLQNTHFSNLESQAAQLMRSFDEDDEPTQIEHLLNIIQ